MKKLILTTLLVTGAALGALAQGTIFANNLNNTGVYGGAGGTPFTGTSGNPTYSPLVISNGLIFTSDPTAQAGNLGYGQGSQMLGVDVNWVLYGGATAGTATTLITGEVGTNGAAAGDNANWGQLYGGGQQYNVPGTTPSSTVFLDLQVWEGTAASYAASTSYKADSGAFANPSSGGAGVPQPLYGLPDMLLTIPEPSIPALSGLGAAALMILRRKSRKWVFSRVSQPSSCMQERKRVIDVGPGVCSF